MIALIPARAGSKRCPGKNTRLLNGHPLIAYTIAAAKQSGVFDRVVVCSDDVWCHRIAETCGAAYVDRAPVPDAQPDVVWVRAALAVLPRADAFAILRPTSPFRTAETIRRAYREFREMADCGDSLRAVKPVTETPYKMWVSTGPPGYDDGYPIRPLLDGAHPDGTPYHSSPTQSLPRVYVQTSSLEMSWTRNVEQFGTIHGRKVAPFFGTEYESFSIDTEADWCEAVRLADEDPARLPPLGVAPLSPVSATECGPDPRRSLAGGTRL